MELKNPSKANDDSETNISPFDMQFLSKVIVKLTKNYENLGKIRQLTAVNMVLRIALQRDVTKLVVPPLDDL